MVKNLSTVERSTKIRFGKNCTDEQGENTIVFNASNEQIDATTPGAVYMTPIRTSYDPNSYLMIYDENTKEIKNSDVTVSQSLAIPTLEEVTAVGNTTTSNIGIANTNPQHLLSVSNTVFMSNTGTYHLQVKGRAYTDYLKVGTAVTINPLDAINQVQVAGQVDTTTLHVDEKIALNNTNPLAYKFSLGNKLFMTDAGNTSLLTTSNISANKYIGDEVHSQAFPSMKSRGEILPPQQVSVSRTPGRP